MKNEQSNYYYWDIGVQTLLIMIIIMVPVYFTTTIHNSFTTEKMMIFRCGTLMAAALMMIKLTYFQVERKIPWQFWLVPMFGLAGILSTIFGINPQVSLWGIHLRMDGLVNMLFLVAFFGITYLQIDTKVKLTQMIWAIALGSIIPAGYALVQKFGLDPVDWKGVVVEERVFGTTGNPAYLGAYLLFTIPITFYLGAISKSGQKILWWAWTIIQVVVILFTWTRASYLALGLELIILAITYFWWTNQQNIAKAIAFIALVLIVFVGALNMNKNLVQVFGSNRYIERIANITQADEGTGRDRLEMWKVAEKAIVERPIFGSGLSQYIQYFNKYYPNYMDARNENDRYSNYSHNLWLDTTVAHGLLGVGILFCIYLSFFMAGISKIREYATKADLKQNFLLLAMLTALIGYLAQAFFNIEIIITWVYSFCLLALLLATINLNEEQKVIQARSVEIWKQIGLTLCSVGILIGIYYLSFAPFMADKLYFDVNNTNKPIDEKMALANQAAALTPYFEYSYIRLGDLLTTTIDHTKPDEATVIYTKVIEQVNNATKINPLNYKNYMSLATIYASWAKIDNSKIKESEKYFELATPTSPDRLGLYWIWGNVYLDLNELAKAKEKFEKARSINTEIGETYYYLAKISFLNGDAKDGENYLQEATNKGFVYDVNKFYSDLALTAYQEKKLEIALVLAGIANKTKVTETAAMVEIQANIELDNSEAATNLLIKYDKLIPGLKNKFVRK
jgi:putative inorganic carbon (HCO3(-)) transporter